MKQKIGGSSLDFHSSSFSGKTQQNLSSASIWLVVGVSDLLNLIFKSRAILGIVLLHSILNQYG